MEAPWCDGGLETKKQYVNKGINNKRVNTGNILSVWCAYRERHYSYLVCVGQNKGLNLISLFR